MASLRILQNINVEVVGYQKHNGVTKTVEYDKKDYVQKKFYELDEFRQELKVKLGGEDDVYLMFRQQG